MRTICIALILGLGSLALWADGLAAPTFQELMDPEMFPTPQRDMIVESAENKGDTVRLRTTGAKIEIDLTEGEVRFAQRIGHERDVVTLRLGKALEGAAITHSTPGLARITIDRPAMTIRLNGDSLFMLHVQEPLTVAVERKIDPGWFASYQTNHLIADEWGAFGLYCSEPDLADKFDAYAETVATYALPADAVLWAGVCPPKPYHWERSLTDNVVWHWSRELGYPPDDALRSWQPHGTVVLLQSEVMLWKNWNLDFVPRLGVEEFARVRKTIHDLDMRFIVYTSPYYFLKGTALEPKALNSFEDFKGWPPGTGTGENMGLFLPAIRRVMAEYKPDGLYFDGQYIENPAALYALAREARAVVGEDGILEWHSTTALGGQHCYLPHADAYVDFILRGEGRKHVNFDYLRYFASGYNIHNSIGVLCNNVSLNMTQELAQDVLEVNARFHTIAGWLDKSEVMRVVEDYRAQLTPALRKMVEQGIDARQARVADDAATRRAEQEALAAPPDWEDPILSIDFNTFPEADRLASPENTDALSVEEGSLVVRGHAHTYAYLRIPVAAAASGFVVRIRQGTDGGMSWGPAAMLVWPDDAGIRIGTRSGGQLQADVLGKQYCGGSHDPDEWVWLRARWLERAGVVERSIDGVTFERLWTFEHDGLTANAAALLVGKVPYNGEPKDHVDPGDKGECAIDFVRVFKN